MCGILVYNAIIQPSLPLAKLQSLTKARGPTFYNSTKQANFTFESSVLALREPLTPQPLEISSCVLAYNGEIYGLHGNDTQYFMDRCLDNISDILQLEGEYAFVFHDGESLWFGRDSIGRRSLVFAHSENNGFMVSSVSDPGVESIQECVAGTLYRFKNNVLTSTPKKQLVSVSLSTNKFDTDLVSRFVGVLMASVGDRMVQLHDAKSIAVLFSGGLDCTLLTRLMDLTLPQDVPIELINVAFENKRTGSLWDTPDRLLARRSLDELRHLSQRRYELVEVNVPYEETVAHTESVKNLMWPANTVMDFSIALAFYFASRGRGIESVLTSKVLISGLGADELFGGYSRHLGASLRSPQDLANELELDFSRLGSRNLGRDDRVCSNWGREVRYPFLDRRVVDMAFEMPLSAKNNGIETKIMLRLAARQLGLNGVTHEKKRAIQFGARSAKMDIGSGRSKGTDGI